MFLSSLTVLSSFLKKYPAKRIASLIEPLSSPMKKDLERAYCPKGGIDPDKFFKKDILHELHYSWYIPLIESFPKKDLAFLLHAFEKNIKEKLEKHLSIDSEAVQPTPLAIDYFQRLIFDKIIDSNAYLLPKEYLPPSDLAPLMDLTKDELVALIDYLSLFDLCLQLPKIVDPTILKKIDVSLSIDKKRFLKKISFYKEPFTFPPLTFTFKSDEKEIAVLLHKRGINRFAKALCNEHEGFIWYICHRLDIGRGLILAKFCEDKIQKEISKTITFNIIELLPIIRNKRI